MSGPATPPYRPPAEYAAMAANLLHNAEKEPLANVRERRFAESRAYALVALALSATSQSAHPSAALS